MRCRNCGGAVDDGVAFCPHCGQPAGATAAAEMEAGAAAPPNVVSLSPFERGREETDKSRRVIFIAVGVVAVLLLAGLAYLASRPSAAPGEERLEGALRPGSPGFPGPDRLVVEFEPDQNADIGPTALGPWAVTFKPVVRNFTGRTVSGLEFRLTGLDLKGQVIRQRIAINRDEIEPNKVLRPPLSINFPQDNRPASLKLELTGVRFK